ncbi:hypothetical protein AQUCO_00700697v1 [Aquilegia coerulea]|uniref:F-box associated beta-propeller type 1 domain-containing protein n=1 Tax=Aquilegia coerulea TaxID=218851 RepID=A0A2G5EL95_AQUCA|nr:hypothetical protein AQUCO_00700697v1 [Aquilegia coerulea]
MSTTHTGSRFEEENLAIQKTIMSTTDAIIHDDIIFEILTRLPAKSLREQFSLVYKPWCDLMTDPFSNFIQTHLNRSMEINCPNFLSTIYSIERRTQFYSSSFSSFDDEEVDAEHIINPFKEIGSETEVLATCNGFICLCMPPSKLCLLNPCTRECKFFNVGKSLYVHDCSAFGLAYDSVVGEYKLVNVRRSLSIYDDCDSLVDVYSLNNDGQATCLSTFGVPYRILNGDIPGIYLNGSLHWVAVHEDRLEIETIVSFDMKGTSFQQLLSPNQFRERASITGVGILRGKLSMLCYFPTGNIQIWAMNNYGLMDSWTQQFAIDETLFPSVCRLRSCTILNKNDEIGRRVIPLHFFNSDKILIFDSIHLVLYDSKQRTTRKLKIRGIENAPLKVMSYIPSLVPFKSATKVQW